MRKKLTWSVFSTLLIASGAPARAGAPDAADLSLEELLKTEVVTVSRKAESLQSTAAAAFVITREDIARSGVTSIPEALRMAPGVEVARIAGNRWAVTVRGFNGRFANKLLVLMDGRSVYSPLFSGVLWEMEDTLIEDVERIEVIRGPGAAIWGANAVNGVINIITRKARDTLGELAVAGSGTKERGFAALRRGVELEDGYLRVWAKAFDRAASVDTRGDPGNDFWRAARVGFRLDGNPAAGSRYTLSGEAYGSTTGDRWNIADPAAASGATPTDVTQAGAGAHLLGRDEWIHADGAVTAFQSYVDWQDVDVEGELHQTRTTIDLDLQHHALIGTRNDVILGLGYRYSVDDVATTGIFDFEPPRVSQTLASAFVQDDFSLLPDRLRLIGGARIEHNNYTGMDLQPNLRAVWTPTASVSLWTAASRAVRTPSRADENAQADLSVTPAAPPAQPFPVLMQSVAPPSGSLQAERVATLELGYRQQVSATFSFDVTGFLSRYRDLRTGQLVGQQFVAAPVPYVDLMLTPVNLLEARTRGAEIAADWRVQPGWRIQPSYSLLRMLGYSASADPIVQADVNATGGNAPAQQWSLRSSWSGAAATQWDLWLRHVAALPNADGSGTVVKAYTTADARAAWRPMPALELSLVGQNLLAARHVEFIPDLLPSVTLAVQRSVYLKAQYQF